MKKERDDWRKRLGEAGEGIDTVDAVVFFVCFFKEVNAIRPLESSIVVRHTWTHSVPKI